MRLRLGIGVIILLVGVLATMKINRSTQEMQTRFAISHEPHPQDDLSSREHALREMGCKEPVVVPVDDLLASDDLMFILRGLDAHYDTINKEVWQQNKDRNFPSDEERNRVLAEETGKRFAPFIPVFVRAADRNLVELKPGTFTANLMEGHTFEVATLRAQVRAIVSQANASIAEGDFERAERYLLACLAMSHRMAEELQDSIVFLVANGSVSIAIESIEAWHADGSVPPATAERFVSQLERISANWIDLAKQGLITSADANITPLERMLDEAEESGEEDPEDLEEARAVFRSFRERHAQLMEVWYEADFEQRAEQLKERTETSMFDIQLPAIMRARTTTLMTIERIDALITHLTTSPEPQPHPDRTIL